jgi:hypothetical protein
MKPQTISPVVVTARCTHHTATGRRCRLSVSDAHSSLCRQHRAELLQEQSADHHLELVRNFEGFQTAQGINHSLKHLYELLAQNRISPRRASVLAYINSLLLRTLPAIDADNQAGIIDPTKPKPLTIPLPDQVMASGADSDPDPAPEPPAASSTPPHEPRVSLIPISWDPGIPEPGGADIKLDPAPEPPAASSTTPHKPRASDLADT